MQIKLDENMSVAHAEFLRQAGYDCDRVTDEGLSGADDDIVWQQACAEGRFFITLDLDFMVLSLIQEAVDRAKSEGRIPNDDRTQQKSDSDKQD